MRRREREKREREIESERDGIVLQHMYRGSTVHISKLQCSM